MSETASTNTAKSSTSSISLKSTQIATPPKGLRPAWLFASSSESTTSGSRRICRICQMHEGEMVRPCDCAGTMGDVHEECLTKWVTMSNKKNCEICQSPYAKSGAQFKPFKEWSKPGYNIKNMFHVVLIIVLALLVAYVWIVMEERLFRERVIQKDMYSRPDDTGRIFLIIILSLAILNNLYTLLMNMIMYLRKQRRIRFIDKHPTQ